MAPKVRHLTKPQRRFRDALGWAIADLRQVGGMSQKELATKIGIGQGPQSQREAGLTTFLADELALYAKAFKTTPSAIVLKACNYIRK